MHGIIAPPKALKPIRRPGGMVASLDRKRLGPGGCGKGEELVRSVFDKEKCDEGRVLGMLTFRSFAR